MELFLGRRRPVATMLAERGLLLRAAKTPWSGVRHLVRSASRFLPRNWSPFRTVQEQVLSKPEPKILEVLKEVP